MTGYKGKIGAIVIVLALVVSVFAGFATNVDKTTTTTTEYDYVTDVSGLFSYEKTPVYVDYDVNKNYIGYQEYTADPNSAYQTTDTYTNTAVSGEVWKTSTSFTGTIPYGSEYILYNGNDTIHIDGDTVEYTQSGTTTTYTDLQYIRTTSWGIELKTSTTTVTLSCNPSTMLYQYISGYDVLGGTPLYQLADGSTFYFKSVSGQTNAKVYQVINGVLTQITSSSTGVTNIPNTSTYRGTVSGIVLAESLTVSDNIEIGGTYTNTYTTSYGCPYDTAYFDFTDVTGTYTVYHNNGHLEIQLEYDDCMVISYDNEGDYIDMDIGTRVYFSEDGIDVDGHLVTGTSEITYIICDDYDFIDFIGTPTTFYKISPNQTYYYNTVNNLNGYYYNGQLVATTNGMYPNSTSISSTGYSATSGTYTIYLTESNPVTIGSITPVTYTNTQDTAHTVYSYGVPTFRVLGTSAYDLYAGQYHITWDDKTVTVIDNGTSDTVTLTTPMTINNNVLTITGQSVRYSGAHTYTVSLTAPYAFSYLSGYDNISYSATTVYRVSGTAYYKSSSTIFGYLNNTMTTSVSGTLYGHGVYTKVVGTSYIWTDSLSVVSDQYTAYDMTALVPTASKGITYTETTQPNAYVVGSINSSGTGNKSLKDNSYIELTLSSVGALYPLTVITDINNTDPLYSGQNTTTYRYGIVNNGVTIQNYVASLNLPTGTTTITLSFERSGNGNSGNNIEFGSATLIDCPSYIIEEHPTYTKMIDGYTIPTDTITRVNGTGTGATYAGTQTITYDCVNNKITNLSWYGDIALNGSDYAFYYVKTWNLPNISNNQFFDFVFNTTTGTYLGDSSYTVTSAQTSNINYAYAYTTPTYMDVREGIKISATNDHSITRWSNGYDNGQVSIVLHVDNASQGAVNVLKLSTGDKITVTHGTNAMTAVRINTGASVDVGVWSNYLLTINAQTGIVTMTPIDIFGNFNQFVLIDYVATVGTIGENQVITYIDWSYTSASWGLSVYQTKVNLNTYGAVMRNPSINIGQYFPDIDNARLNLYSFALYGDTMTVNGVTYYGGSGTQSIKETGNVYIQNKSYKLQNIYITYADGKTYLTFVDDNHTLDLGQTTNGTLSFGGFWYYTTGLYEGHETTSTSYNWNVSQFGFSMSGLALLALGLTLLGVIVARRFMAEEMTAIDYVLIVGAIMFYLALIGGIML